MLKRIGLLLAAIVAVILVVAAFRPHTFTVTRSAEIDAGAGKIMAHVTDFHRWTAWSPWEGLDPNLKRTYSGPARGVGATYAWDGNGHVGSGSMTITEVTKDKVVLRLDFIRPMAAQNTTEFEFVPAGHATRVTWTMTGPVPYVARILHMFMNMDRMVGGMFDRGLANLKAVSEKR